MLLSVSGLTLSAVVTSIHQAQQSLLVLPALPYTALHRSFRDITVLLPVSGLTSSAVVTSMPSGSTTLAVAVLACVN